MTSTDASVATAGLPQALEELRAAVARTTFALDHPARAERVAARDRLARDLDGHAARLRDLDAPLLVVAGGVTGAGKSTFVNTLVGKELLATGPLRPTTFAPALVCHPGDVEWFAGDRVLPALPRVEGDAPAAGGDSSDELRLVRSAAIPPGLAVVDAPDVDSVSSANRALADQLLDAADLWLWFTTAGKYADEESMRYLRRARARRTALAVVLTQVHDADVAEVTADFRGKLAAEGLDAVRLFTVPVTTISHGRLPGTVATELRGWLASLGDAAARRAHRLQTLRGALDAVPGEVGTLIEALDDEARLTAALAGDVDAAYDDARRQFAAALDEGLPLRQEVVARWDRFVGAGRALKLTEAATGQARAWVKSLLANVGVGEEQRLERQVRVEVADTVAGLIGQLADLAAAEVVARWAATPAGRRLVADAGVAPRRSDGLDDRAETAVRDWQRHVADLVASAGASRRLQARVVSSVVSVAATSAILLAMASAGITGAEVGIAAAAGAANQGLLVKLLGEANLRALVAEARQDLLARFADLATEERARFTAALADVTPDPDEAAALEAACDRLVAARSAGG